MWRSVRAVLALTTVFVLVGCATVPTSGPVEHHTPQSNPFNSGVHVDPLPPAAGASQLLVVEGFLHAMGVYQPDYAIARQYLTEAASKNWHPESGVQIYGDTYPPYESDQTVVLNAPLTGTLDADGRYRPAATQLRHDFRLQRDSGGQWRIDNPPEGLLVSRYLFTTSFVSVSLHFLDTTEAVLVPDPRFFAAGDQALTAAVQAQLDGPSEWLAAAVRSVDTASVGVAGTSLGPDGTLDVTLDGESGRLTIEQRTVLLAELAYTLTDFDQVAAIRVNGAGQIWRGDAGQTEVGPDDYRALSPSDATSARAMFVYREKKLQQVRNANDWTDLETLDVNLGRIEQFAVRRDVGEVSAIVGGGTRLQSVEPGSDKIRVLRTGSGLLRPDYARNGELWSPSTSGAGELKVFRGDAPVAVDARSIPDGTVVAAKLSPDGVRVALVLRRSGRSEVGTAVVQRGEAGIVLSGWRPLDIALTTVSTGGTLDLGWISTTELAVLQSSAGGDTSVIRISQDGATGTDIGPIQAPTLTRLAAIPGRAAALAAGGSVYRFDGELNWTRALTAVDAFAYSG